jgi:hypothetical protein
MKIRALLYDLARSQRVNMAHMKKMIERLSGFGFNMLVINLEYRFDFPSCPGMAPSGSLTIETAQELTEYGKKKGVAVVGQPNLACHCEGIGATELYADYTCDPYEQKPWGGYEQLDLGKCEVRKLVKNMIRDVCEAFPGDFLHIGGDEIRQMHVLFPDDVKMQDQMLKEYISFLLEAAQETGRRIMIWGDMPLKHPELLPGLSRDIIICDWHYAPEGSRETLAKYKELGFNVIAAPAVSTCSVFCLEPHKTYQNMLNMIGDARDLELDGFLLTTWEFGKGSAFPLVWPWVALGGSIARGEKINEWESYVKDFAVKHYKIESGIVQLYNALNENIIQAFELSGVKLPCRFLAILRESLFRAANPFSDIVRRKEIPPNKHQQIWEPSPFHSWLYVRAILNEKVLSGLDSLAETVERLITSIKQQTTQLPDDLIPLLSMGKAFLIFVERIHLLEAAKRNYHAAAQVQKGNPKAFEKHIKDTVVELRRICPQLAVLHEIVSALDELSGFDKSEYKWINVHERSLKEHIEMLDRLTHKDEPLLEFGEFLRRPADISARVVW